MSSDVWLGLTELKDALTGIVAKAELATRQAVADSAHLVEAKAKANATGRPGPNVVSGDLRRSIHVDGPVRVGILGYSAKIGPSVIYARRIELGYHKTDSLGRRYNQPAYPYLKPGMDEAKPQISGIFDKAWSAATKGR